MLILLKILQFLTIEIRYVSRLLDYQRVFNKESYRSRESMSMLRHIVEVREQV